MPGVDCAVFIGTKDDCEVTNVIFPSTFGKNYNAWFCDESFYRHLLSVDNFEVLSVLPLLYLLDISLIETNNI